MKSASLCFLALDRVIDMWWRVKWCHTAVTPCMDMLLDRKPSLQVQRPVQGVCAAAGPGLSLVNPLC